jgi:hypothetical protein
MVELDHAGCIAQVHAAVMTTSAIFYRPSQLQEAGRHRCRSDRSRRRRLRTCQRDREVHNIGVNRPHHVFVNQSFKVTGAD